MLQREVTEEEAKIFALKQFGAIMSYVRQRDRKLSNIHRVNIVELVTELAHAKLIDDFNGKSSKGVYVADEDGTRYTDEAQETFDGYYDSFYSMIQDLTI